MFLAHVFHSFVSVAAAAGSFAVQSNMAELTAFFRDLDSAQF